MLLSATDGVASVYGIQQEGTKACYLNISFVQPCS